METLCFKFHQNWAINEEFYFWGGKILFMDEDEGGFYFLWMRVGDFNFEVSIRNFQTAGKYYLLAGKYVQEKIK